LKGVLQLSCHARHIADIIAQVSKPGFFDRKEIMQTGAQLGVPLLRQQSFEAANILLGDPNFVCHLKRSLSSKETFGRESRIRVPLRRFGRADSFSHSMHIACTAGRLHGRRHYHLKNGESCNYLRLNIKRAYKYGFRGAVRPAHIERCHVPGRSGEATAMKKQPLQ
jgi:hypothetical protein